MRAHRYGWVVVGLALVSEALAAPRLVPTVVVLGAKPTDADRAKQKAERKLNAFEKEYDPAKKLANKGPGLPKDIADLDQELDALAALDAAAGAELRARRNSLVEAAQNAVAAAAGDKAAGDLDKKFERAEKDFDPEGRNMLNLDRKSLERTTKELDDLITKLDASARAPYQARRDALLKKVETGVAAAKVEKLRKGIVAPEKVAPLPGVEAIAPQTPTWCAGVVEAQGNLDNFTASLPAEVRDARGAILFSCLDPDWDVRQQVVAAFRQKLSNALRLTAAMNERLMKLGGALTKLKDEDEKAQGKALCSTLLPPLTDGTAEARANRSLERIAVQCGNRLSDENKMRLRDVDVPGGLPSQLATSQVVLQVITAGAEGERPDYVLGQASDVATLNAGLRFDPAVFVQQLDAMKLNEVGQSRAISAYFSGRARLLGFLDAYKELGPKVAGLQKYVFDAPAAAVKAFTADSARDQELLELVLTLEAQSSKGLKGCTQKLWPRLVAEVKGQGKAALDEVKVNPLLAYALALCARRDPEAPGLEAIFSGMVERHAAVRGPLGAAYRGAFDAYNELGGKPAGFEEGRRGGSGVVLGLPAPERAPVEDPELPESVFGHDNTVDLGRVMGGGVVKALERKGETVKIIFRTEKFKVPDYNCVETGKIDRITAEGQLIYRRFCTRVGEHEEASTAQPFEVPSWAVGGIGPGSFVVPLWQAINSSAAGHGWIIEAWDSKARGKRTSLFGIAL